MHANRFQQCALTVGPPIDECARHRECSECAAQAAGPALDLPPSPRTHRLRRRHPHGSCQCSRTRGIATSAAHSFLVLVRFVFPSTPALPERFPGAPPRARPTPASAPSRDTSPPLAPLRLQIAQHLRVIRQARRVQRRSPRNLDLQTRAAARQPERQTPNLQRIPAHQFAQRILAVNRI